MKSIAWALPCLLLAAVPSPSAAVDLVHHDIRVTLSPETHSLAAVDNVTLPQGLPPKGRSRIPFTLHAGLSPRTSTPGARLEKEKESGGVPPTETYALWLPPGTRTVSIEYEGEINHPLGPVGEEYARGQKDTPGAIGPEGIYLTGPSGWYPEFEGEGMISFTLTVDMPPEWDAVSQGGRDGRRSDKDGARVVWRCPEPQEEIDLMAGRYSEYVRDAGRAKAMVFLREPDAALAGLYLDAAVRYLEFYDKLIGMYPYPKFALVENFWETGYGLPSFTLLGPTVLRLPFIIDTSYPHEILHNWWGNGVYVDYGRGNWSEGLTAYLADHLLKERQGGGAEYRQSTLQKYTDYVLKGRDLPLSEFRSRHGSVTEAVGYGKSLMLFHMLRLALGDDTFIEGLRTLYKDGLFRTADFADVRKSFEKAAGRGLRESFEPWVTRVGAPRLRIKSARVEPDGSSFRLRVVLEQVQKERPFPVRVPIAVTLAGTENAFQSVVTMTRHEEEADLRLPARPLRLDVDPEFDVFRRLDRNEIPPALTQAFGAERALIVLPSAADASLREGYRALAETLRRSGPGQVEVAEDKDVKEFPRDRSVWLLGWENRFRGRVEKELGRYGAAIGRESVRLEGREIPRREHSFALAVRHPEDPDLALLWIAGDDPAAFPGLGRKLPHYHKYSDLVFEGKEPVNVVKGRWPVTNSPLTVLLPREDGSTAPVAMASMAPRKALAEPLPAFSRDRMMETVRVLADPGLAGRGLGTTELDRAAEYIAQRFDEAGLLPGGEPEGNWFQTFTGRVGDSQEDIVMKNVIGILPGAGGMREGGESVVVAAHYDHLGMGGTSDLSGNGGKIHPGADDDASGVAVLLDLARVLAKGPPPGRTVVFAAFTGEDSGRLGSRHYVARERRCPAAKAVGMINLDTVGRLEAKTLLVLDGESAGEWAPLFRGAGARAGVETEIVAEGLSAGDQASFLAAGIPAVQLSTGPHPDHHRPTDTFDRIDGNGLMKIAAVAHEAVAYLAGRPGSLTSTLRPADAESSGKRELSGGRPAGRKVSLGAIPDFACQRTGVCLSGVMAGSPAERAGLRVGDVIVRINDVPVGGLKELAGILGSLSAGQRAMVVFVRDGRERSADVILDAR